MDLPILAKEEVLERVDGDVEFLKELTTEFLSRVSGELAQLNLFISENDCVNTEQKAHSIKGTLRNLGALKSGDSADRIEHAAKHGDLSKADIMAAELKERIDEYQKEFEKFISDQ